MHFRNFTPTQPGIVTTVAWTWNCNDPLMISTSLWHLRRNVPQGFHPMKLWILNSMLIVLGIFTVNIVINCLLNIPIYVHVPALPWRFKWNLPHQVSPPFMCGIIIGIWAGMCIQQNRGGVLWWVGHATPGIPPEKVIGKKITASKHEIAMVCHIYSILHMPIQVANKEVFSCHSMVILLGTKRTNPTFTSGGVIQSTILFNDVLHSSFRKLMLWWNITVRSWTWNCHNHALKRLQLKTRHMPSYGLMHEVGYAPPRNCSVNEVYSCNLLSSH